MGRASAHRNLTRAVRIEAELAKATCTIRRAEGALLALCYSYRERISNEVWPVGNCRRKGCAAHRDGQTAVIDWCHISRWGQSISKPCSDQG